MGPRTVARISCRSSISLGLGFIASTFSCAVVPSGHQAVLLTATRGLQADPLQEGVHVVAPWNRVDVFDLRGQEHDEDIWALTSDGAPLEARASLVTFRLVPNEIAQLDREVGPDYYRVLIQPFVRSTVRLVLARYRASQITSENILEAQKEISKDAARRLLVHHIVLDSIDLRTMAVRLEGLYANTLATAAVEQEALAGPTMLEIARRRAEARHEEAVSAASAHARIAPTLSDLSLIDEAHRAEARLLSSPGTNVVVASPGDPVRLEVIP